jgi:hypothetical protein
MVLVVNRTC